VFALIGLGWSWRTKKHRLELGLLAAYAAIHLLVGLLFFVSTRYRAPAAPALGVLAAFGIRASVVQLGRSKWAAILLVGGIVAVGVTKLDPLGGEASFRALSSFNRGVALLREGRAAEALDRFREASKAEPEDPLYRLHIGNALVAMGEEVEARESYLKAIEMKPSYSLAHINLGVLACRRHDYQACLRHLKQGARLAPYLPESHLRLAQALMLTGRSKEAKSHLIRARNLADEVAPDQARLAEKLLRRIRSRPKQSR
jgi:tetratricopeptide (TPR) repeat protein